MKFKALYTILLFFSLSAWILKSPEYSNNWWYQATENSEHKPTTTPIPARDLDLLPTFNSLVMQKYENCSLPCWWELTLGETTLKDISQFVQRHQFDRQWKQSIYANTISLEDYLRAGELAVLYFQEDLYSGNFQMSFGFDEDDQLKGILLRFFNPSEWLEAQLDNVSFAKVLTQIEETPEIYINEYRSTFRLSDYDLIVLFRQSGVKVHYKFDLLDDNPEDALEGLRLCLGLDKTVSIEMSFIAGDYEGETYDENWKTPENASGIGVSTEEFVQFFREHPDECLDVSQIKSDG